MGEIIDFAKAKAELLRKNQQKRVVRIEYNPENNTLTLIYEGKNEQ